MKVRIKSRNGNKITNLNRRKAVKERCLDCSGWSAARRVNCDLDDCDLHPFRTGLGKQNAKARHIAIRVYCLWCSCGSVKEVKKCAVKTCALFPYRNSIIDKSVEIVSTVRK